MYRTVVIVANGAQLVPQAARISAVAEALTNLHKSVTRLEGLEDSHCLSRFQDRTAIIKAYM